MSILRPKLFLTVLLCLVSAPPVVARTAVHECDRLAAQPKDGGRVAPGVIWRDLEPRAAVAACRAAVAAFPRTQRFRYQLGRALTKAGDSRAAIEILRPSADHGYAMAQLALGNLYAGGNGIARNLKSAVAWYRKAAEQGNVPAQNNLARMYLRGHGVNRDYGQAIEWFTRAVGNGSAVARTNLGNLYYVGRGVPRNHATAVMWYRKAADLDHIDAQLKLGSIYEIGRGVEQDFAAAFELYRRAGELGSTVAQTNVGLMYMQGRGVAADDVKAMDWFRKAAARDHAAAQNNLGLMYSQARGVARNDTIAVDWYHAAARQGYAVAQNNLGLMYAEGRGVSKDEAKAALWIRRAAEQGNADAQFNLGVMYSRGRGVPQNLAKSATWHIRAARQDIATGRGLRLPSSSPRMCAAISALAVLPAILFVWGFTRSRRNRPCTGKLWNTAGLGALVAVGALLIGFVVPGALPGSSDAGSPAIVTAFLVAAAPEELGRFCVLYFYCLKRGMFSRPMNGLIFGVVVSLGFSAFENAVYAYSGGIEVLIVKSATTAPLHIAFGAIMGGLLAIAASLPNRRGMMVGLALCAPFLLHGFHNFVVLTAMGAASAKISAPDGLLVASMGIILGLSLFMYWRLRKQDAAYKP